MPDKKNPDKIGAQPPGVGEALYLQGRKCRRSSEGFVDEGETSNAVASSRNIIKPERYMLSKGRYERNVLEQSDRDDDGNLGVKASELAMAMCGEIGKTRFMWTKQ